MTSIERGTSDTALKTIHESISQAEQAMRNARTIIKAQAARIAELERQLDYNVQAVDRADEEIRKLERVIKRTHAHVVADRKAIALNMLRSNIAYITEKEKGQDERHNEVVPVGSEPRPELGPAARGKSAIVSECYYASIRPEKLPAFTATARGERYLRLIEQLGDDSTTFRAWWTNIGR